MNKLVEITGHSEALDAEWFCSLLGKDTSSLSIRDCLGAVGDILDVGQLIFGKYRLVIIYDKQQFGLFSFFSSDKRVGDYIFNNTESAFYEAIKEHSPGIYVLNIASVENFGAFDWKNAKDLLNKQLQIFMPIIQKFMADALTDSLKV